MTRRPLLREIHGNRACYLNGCRCDECRAANRDYRNGRRRTHQPGTVITVDTLPTECWCRTHIIDVPRQDVLNGHTLPCDNPHCRTLDTRRRPQEDTRWAS